MQVVIDIPKEIYELCAKDDYFVYKETDIIRQAIKNGTPFGKIRAEIMSKDGLEEALEIIDKHRAAKPSNSLTAEIEDREY